MGPRLLWLGLAWAASAGGRVAERTEKSAYANCPGECRCWNVGGVAGLAGAECGEGGLDERGLRRILAALPRSLGVLSFRAPHWRPNNFSVSLDILRFKHLKELHFVNCGLGSLGKRVFAALPALRVLNVAGNRISYLSPETFEATDHLWHLSLADNALGQGLLPTGAFAHLRQLRSLDLSRNHLHHFPANLFTGLGELASLVLDGSRLDASELTGLLSDVPALRRLSLRNASLEGLNKDTFRAVEDLEELSLVEASLEEVPTAALQPLKHLRSLDLSRNRISSLHPYALADLPATLQSLSLAHNRLGDGHENTVSGHGDFGIHRLALANSSLASLDLSGNGYTDFDARVLGAAAGSLRVLALSHNPLRRIRARHTAHLQLHSLHLAGIHLAHLPHFLPAHFSQLRLLNLSGNPLSRFPSSTASSLVPGLRELDISQCRFRSLPRDLEDFFFGQLERLFLSGNPWDCGCHLKPLLGWVQRRWSEAGAAWGSRDAEGVGELRCATPQRHAGQRLRAMGAPRDCALLFSAASGLTQRSEIGILVAAVGSVLLLVGVGALIGCYARLSGPGRLLGGRSYRTREGSKGRLTPASSSEPSEPSETNSLHPHPPLHPNAEFLF